LHQPTFKENDMSTNQSSNRNDLNAGSDTSHMRDTGKAAYDKARAITPATQVTNIQSNGAVGNGKPGKPSEASDVK
jgi:ssDNA-binding replication factor A large subunit